MDKKPGGATAIIAAVMLIIGAGAGYFTGSKLGFSKGYAKAETDLKAVQEEAAKKAADEAAKAANPFQVANPLDNVDTNPFEKVKKILNPFE